MHNLVILCRYDPMAEMEDKEFEIDTDFDTSSQAELRALRWLTYRPNDIVMLLSLETAVCRNCDQGIEENAGWVLHKWIHTHSGAYTCFTTGFTKAEPKEA